MRVLNTEEVQIVAGGLGIMQMIEEAIPGGVWVGNSYYPNGVPTGPYVPPITTT